MAAPAEFADGLRFKLAGVEVQHLHVVGTIPGVNIEAVAALNGPGTGLLRSSGDGTDITWKAPGSLTSGPVVSCTVDQSYLFEDGDDPDKWLRARVIPTELQPGTASGQVYLKDVYSNAIAHDDLTAPEALAGDVATYTVDLHNDSADTMTDVRVWLDAAVVNLEISDDGATWVSPTDEGTALVFASIASMASSTLHLRRTIPPASTSDPGVLDEIHARFTIP